MGKKIIVPIKGTGYKVVHGSVTGTSGSYGPVTLQFDSKIIAVFFRYAHGSGYNGNGYYVNPNRAFWNNDGTFFDNSYPLSVGLFYIYNTANYVKTTVIDDYGITVQYSSSTSGTGTCEYTAILEESSENQSLFLLNGTILYTDGTVTSEVEGAIETLDTNKYKIKSNALVTIADATYVDISN